MKEKSPNLSRARAAVFTVFVVSGLALASWMARIPEVRDHLALAPSELGRTLLLGAVGSFMALPTAGLVVNRLGPARTVAAGAVVGGAGLAAVGFGVGPVASVWLVMAGLFACGYGIAVWDVAMNVEGADVERALDRSLMPRLHAGFSLGSVAGAGLGAAAAWSGVPVAAHLWLVGTVVVAVVLVAVRFFLPRSAGTADSASGDRARARLRDAWREPRTLLIGVLVLTFALAEGVANEWLAVGLVDGFDVSPAVGAAGFAVFVTAMTVTRILGGSLIDRWGRVPVLRASAVGAIVGVLLVVFGTLPVALLGVIVWGAGAALGFPMGMSAGADDPERAAIRVSVVSSIGYTAFLMGPPLLGWLGDRVGVHRALLVVAVAMVVGAVVAVAARRPGEVGRRAAAASDPGTSAAADAPGSAAAGPVPDGAGE